MFGPSDGFFAGCSEVVLLLLLVFFFVIYGSCLWFMLMFVMLYCLFLTALCSPAGIGLIFLLSCVFFSTFPYGVQGQEWYLITSIPDLCLHLYLRSRGH